MERSSNPGRYMHFFDVCNLQAKSLHPQSTNYSMVDFSSMPLFCYAGAYNVLAAQGSVEAFKTHK